MCLCAENASARLYAREWERREIEREIKRGTQTDTDRDRRESARKIRSIKIHSFLGKCINTRIIFFGKRNENCPQSCTLAHVYYITFYLSHYISLCGRPNGRRAKVEGSYLKISGGGGTYVIRGLRVCSYLLLHKQFNAPHTAVYLTCLHELAAYVFMILN